MEDLSTKVDLRYLLGIINSQYASVLLSNIRGGDYHIVPEHIRNIPIPLATKEQQHRIAIIVDKILKAKQEDSQADTSKEEKEIDRLVYKLYGLTYDEVKIVAPETSITYEEYDNFKL
jgi:adenine-specific DNA-methyltransferase